MQPPEPFDAINREVERSAGPSQNGLTRIGATRPREILMVGASIRSAAHSARTAGFQVTGIDLFGDVDTRRLCARFATFQDLSNASPEHIDGWLDSCTADSCLVVGGLGREWGETLGHIRARKSALGSSQEQELAVSDPKSLALIAGEAGLAFPVTRELHDFIGPPQDNLTDARWLSKDGAHSSGGLGVRWYPRRRMSYSSASGTDKALPKYVQRWLPGRSYGASFFADGHDVCLLGVCRSSHRRIGEFPFVYAGSLGPVQISRPIRESLERLGHRVVDRNGLRGVFGADVIIGGDILGPDATISLLEINPRWTASCELIEASLLDRGCKIPGRTLIGAVIADASAADMSSALADSIADQKRMQWKKIVYARHSGRFELGSFPISHDRTLSGDNRNQLEYRLVDIPEDGRHVARNEPILSVIATRPVASARGAVDTTREFRKLIRRIQNQLSKGSVSN